MWTDEMIADVIEKILKENLKDIEEEVGPEEMESMRKEVRRDFLRNLGR